jgi:hypothetical protein
MSNFSPRMILLLLLAGFVGACAAPGETENYKVLEHEYDGDRFHTEPATRRDHPAETVQLARGRLAKQPQLAVTVDNSEKQIGTIDRSGWAKISFAPVDGTVAHRPTYMMVVPVGADMIGVLQPHEPVWRMAEALDGAAPAGASRENLLDAIIDPAMFGLSLVSMPGQMVVDAPWSVATTR